MTKYDDMVCGLEFQGAFVRNLMHFWEEGGCLVCMHARDGGAVGWRLVLSRNHLTGSMEGIFIVQLQYQLMAASGVRKPHREEYF